MTTPVDSSRGARINPKSKYLKSELVFEHPEGLDEAFDPLHPTTYLLEYPKKIINRIDSPDIPTDFSVNPYQGCEHGCTYCYARNTHAYWGLSPGLDFEQKIIVKPEAPRLLEAEMRKRNWKPAPIMLSGNTDCYQPAERHWKITRQLLEVALKFRNPIGISTKNKLVLRDLDLLKELASLNLVHVYLSITSLDKKIRRVLEPRTVTGKQRLETVRRLSEAGIPAGVMVAPIIPRINALEIPTIIEAAAAAGALNEAAIDAKTAVVCTSQVHWVCGGMLDLPRVSSATKAVGAALVLDLTQSISVVDPDITACDPDFVVAARYKWLMGPYSLGLLYVAPRHRGGAPLEEGWIVREASHDFARLVDYRDEYLPGARRYDVGERSSFALVPAAIAACRQLLGWGRANLSETLGAMTSAIADGARPLGARALPEALRAPHYLGLRFEEGLPEGLVARLAAEGVHVSVRGDRLRITPHLYKKKLFLHF